ncbi:MAG: arginine--tRNA ligase [Candidatus Nanosyncoccus sp.]
MEKIGELLRTVISSLYNVEAEINLVEAPKDTGADFATNIAMNLAKNLKKNPMQIAEEVRGKTLELDVANEREISEIEIAKPGFINIKLSDDFYKLELEKYQKNFLENISQNEYLEKTVICEFSDPNPFKILHVGHLYTSMVGDAISRIVEFAGGNVVRANFGGDVGLHVAKNMYALLQHKDEINDLMTTTEKAELLSKTYVEGATAYEEDEVAKEKIVEINKKIYRIAEAGDSIVAELEGLIERDASRATLDELELAKVYFWGRKASYQYFKDFYKKIGVKFDRYYPESTVAAKGLEMVTKGLGDGVYEESDGAIVFKGEKYGLHTRVFINKNGLPTYEAKDVGLIFTKWEDYHFDKSIIITGNDIIDYMKVVLKSVEQYAPELSKRTLHLTHGQVKLPGREKMSSRKGNFLKAVDVIELIREELIKVQEGLSQNKGEPNPEEVDLRILLGAIRYAFLKYKVGGDIVFDVKESVSMTGNSGPYLQYSAVRAQKVLGKILESQVEKTNKKVEQKEWTLVVVEKNLIKKIMQYKNVLGEVVGELSPSKLCIYLYEIAQDFSRFYENVQVVGSEYEVERGAIVLAYLKVLTHGLSILGIEIPEKM